MDNKQIDGWPKGVHIVHSTRNSCYVKYNISPVSDFNLLAAAMIRRREIEKAIERGFSLKTPPKLTEKQWEAFAAFRRAGGCKILTTASIAEIYDEILEALCANPHQTSE